MIKTGRKKAKMQNKETESIDSLSKAECLLWSSQVKQWIKLASIAVTIVVTGQKITKTDKTAKLEKNITRLKGRLKTVKQDNLV